MNVFLCDLSHVTDGHYGSEVVPYGVACLRAYLRKDVRDEFNVRIFKDVDGLNRIYAVEKPQIIGFANYMWNTDLSCQIARLVKEVHPETFVVFGGPNFPLESHRQEQWLRSRPYIDAYLQGDGEDPLLRLCRTVRDHGAEYAQHADIMGLCAVAGESFLKVIDGQYADGTDKIPRMASLDSIPSPYLNGSLDVFLADPLLLPMLESNRGCPFTCTFCADGSRSRGQVFKHSPERMIDELWYVAARTKSKTLIMADDNFGMYEEDVRFSETFRLARERWGFPHYVVAATGKNRKNRVLQVADNMDGTLRVAASVQSLDPDVLTFVERDNISQEDLSEVALSATRSNTYSELILGLPGDTRAKHTSGILQLMDAGFDQIRMHQLTLFDGARIATDAHRQQFGLVSRQRVLQRSFGRYVFDGSPVCSIETEEIVVTHNSMSLHDYLYCRTFALTVALFYNDRVFWELSRYFRHVGLQYSQFILALHSALQMRDTMRSPLSAEYAEFAKAAENEFDCLLQPTDELWNSLEAGRVGNNLLFNTQAHILFRKYSDLCVFAFSMARKYFRSKSVAYDGHYLSQLERYCLLKKGCLHLFLSDLSSQDFDTVATFLYNFVAMENADFLGPPIVGDITLRFMYDPQQKELLESQIASFGTSERGLGKLIARCPIRETYRHVQILFRDFQEKDHVD